jgi:hypothetical protein
METKSLPSEWLKKEDGELLGDLFQAVGSYLHASGGIQHSTLRREAVLALPRWLRALFLTTTLDAEVYNGGFVQYLSNRNAILMDEALEDLKWIGAEGRAGIVSQVVPLIHQLRREHPVLLKYETTPLDLTDEEKKLLNDCWWNVEENYEAKFDALADEYYKVAENTPFQQSLIDRCRKNPEECGVPANMI